MHLLYQEHIKIYRSLYGDLRIRQIASSKGYLPGAVVK